jgi:hypothetical protein
MKGKRSKAAHFSYKTLLYAAIQCLTLMCLKNVATQLEKELNLPALFSYRSL